MASRPVKIVLWGLAVVSLLAVGGGAGLYYRVTTYADEVPSEGAGRDIQVEIARGMSFPAVVDRLAEKGIIESPLLFRLYGMKRKLTTRIKSGTYTLRDDMTPQQVLDALVEGVKELGIAVTIPEGLHMLEVFALLEEKKVAPKDELLRLARDPEFLKAQGISAPSLEGYLFPETYRFKADTPAKQVLATLIRQYRMVWSRIRSEHTESFGELQTELSWTDHQVLIMASIVEKEAAVAAERPRIAQVFLNRLIKKSFRPKLLQTDPSIRYGCTVPEQKSKPCQGWDSTGRLRRAQLDDAGNPYNTYQHQGLPPGPIANPGEEALRAVVAPDGSDFFYFVAKNDGTHAFAKTVREHQRNVDKYQR